VVSSELVEQLKRDIEASRPVGQGRAAELLELVDPASASLF
jgi:hypothetical protein